MTGGACWTSSWGKSTSSTLFYLSVWAGTWTLERRPPISWRHIGNLHDEAVSSANVAPNIAATSWTTMCMTRRRLWNSSTTFASTHQVPGVPVVRTRNTTTATTLCTRDKRSSPSSLKAPSSTAAIITRAQRQAQSRAESSPIKTTARP